VANAANLRQGTQVPSAAQPFEQVPALAHCPFWSQICAMLFVHCLLPGLQKPLQVPVSQTKLHTPIVFHIMPSVLQSCWVLPLHRPAPGVQIPVHALLRHTYGHAAVVY